jgi:HEAT repeat protein
MMLPLLLDPDPGVIADDFFALGILGDTAAISAIVARLERPDSLTSDGVSEAATAIVRIGGPRAGQLFGRIIASREPGFPAKRLDAFRVTGMLDAWRQRTGSGNSEFRRRSECRSAL